VITNRWLVNCKLIISNQLVINLQFISNLLDKKGLEIKKLTFFLLENRLIVVWRGFYYFERNTISICGDTHKIASKSTSFGEHKKKLS